ncbi:MAG: hypothetical protein K2X38_16220 [Gemmataceae bacterium]|nr:hypothetical protein [Gemmataceae bacterium]
MKLWAYVIMPEHVRLIIQPGIEETLVSKFLAAAKEPVARKAVKRLKSTNSAWLDRIAVQEGDRLRHRFWQPGGGYDRNITCSETLRLMIEYIHANPFRRGLVEDVLKWQWSSAMWFAGMRPCKLEMDVSVLEVLASG